MKRQPIHQLYWVWGACLGLLPMVSMASELEHNYPEDSVLTPAQVVISDWSDLHAPNSPHLLRSFPFSYQDRDFRRFAKEGAAPKAGSDQEPNNRSPLMHRYSFWESG